LTKAEVLQWIRTRALVPVLRAGHEEQAMALAEAIIAAGIDVLEVTMTVPGALLVMRRLAREWPDVLIGAGTVLDPETARACIDEGAQFIVSPALNIKTVEFCRQSSIAVLPGALTPTEIVTAWQAGADVIKVFPADAMGGPAYLRSLKRPLPQIELTPTGGVSPATAKHYLEAGAFALGIGSDLVDTRAIAEGHPETITERARVYLQIVADFQAEASIKS